jgi:hypothetical protein
MCGVQDMQAAASTSFWTGHVQSAGRKPVWSTWHGSCLLLLQAKQDPKLLQLVDDIFEACVEQVRKCWSVNTVQGPPCLCP